MCKTKLHLFRVLRLCDYIALAHRLSLADRLHSLSDVVSIKLAGCVSQSISWNPIHDGSAWDPRPARKKNIFETGFNIRLFVRHSVVLDNMCLTTALQHLNI